MRLIFSSDSAILITQHKNNLVFNGPVPALVRVFCAVRLKIRLNIVFGIKKNPETIETTGFFAISSIVFGNHGKLHQLRYQRFF